MSPACRGFPPAITQLKGVLERMHPTLPKENPGSRWPKSSLGALRDDKRLTPDQLQLLLKICAEEGGNLQEAGLQPLEIDRAALCIFECRSVPCVPAALSLLLHESRSQQCIGCPRPPDGNEIISLRAVSFLHCFSTNAKSSNSPSMDAGVWRG